MISKLQSYDQQIEFSIARENKIVMTIRRFDLIHPFINGNKWFKLKYNLEAALQSSHRTILSFGGAWSNHIYALAAAGSEHGLKTIGIIRGESPATLSSTLEFAKAHGMELHFVTREAYDLKESEDFTGWLHAEFGAFHLVPEGGSNYLGINGAIEMLDETDQNTWDIIVCAGGTGASAAGIALKMAKDQQLWVFPAIKQVKDLEKNIRKHIRSIVPDTAAVNEIMNNVRVIDGHHFGGYARTRGELISFIKGFQDNFRIPLDQVYTGKMLYGLLDLARNGNIDGKKRILIIHSGGLQGRNSIPELRST